MRGLGYPVRRTVIVNLKSGDSLQGILWRRHPRYIVLKETPTVPITLHRNGSTRGLKVDHEAMVERREILFLQVLP